MNQAEILEIIREEGTVLYAYDDATGERIVPGYVVVGHPTIGTGRCLDEHGITADEADFLLVNDIGAVDTALKGYLWWPPLDAVRQMVLVSMALNMGISGMLSFRHMINAVSAHDYNTAAVEMLSSRWAIQVPNRAKRLAQIMRTGQIPAGRPYWKDQ